MMKKKYVVPELDIIRFMTEDVITISGEDSSPEVTSEPEQPVLPWD